MALDMVPTAWLDRVFAAAIRAHRGPGLVQPGEVGDAWDGLLTERQAGLPAERQLPAGPAPVCVPCAGKGWLIDRAHGTPGYRDLHQCPACSGPHAPDRGPDDYTVSALLVVLQEWGAEHADPLPLPVRLRYALACRAAGAPPYDLRRLLDSTQEPTLYRALTALDIAVDPPADPVPGAPGYWQRAGGVIDGQAQTM